MSDILRETLKQLAALPYKDLRDLLDIHALETADDPAEESAARQRRKGIKGGSARNLILRTAAARRAWKAINKLEADELETAVLVINLLHEALKPKPQRRRRAISKAPPAQRPPDAWGSVIVKTIPRNRVVRGNDGMPMIDADGRPVTETIRYRYVYIQVSESAGGLDGMQKHQRSIYLQKSGELAYELDNADKPARDALVKRILAAFQTDNADLPAGRVPKPGARVQAIVDRYTAAPPDDEQEADQPPAGQ